MLIRKDDQEYEYPFEKNKELIPIQLGKGIYSIKILAPISENRYSVLDKKVFNSIGNYDYLKSAQPVYFDDNDLAVKIGNILTNNSNDEYDKILAIHQYIVKNIKYDYDKMDTIKNNYVPNTEKILYARKGICYDHAVLFASMLRSQNIPTKLVKGYVENSSIYHAWNEIWYKNEWHIIDITSDILHCSQKPFFQRRVEYIKSKEY